ALCRRRFDDYPNDQKGLGPDNRSDCVDGLCRHRAETVVRTVIPQRFQRCLGRWRTRRDSSGGWFRRSCRVPDLERPAIVIETIQVNAVIGDSYG
ncbi:hypothetical protein, partial [Paenibacillus polymyxa]|uniref:hypothetical protein n=1 Tax=Paenibacillus polymyxa TaxID=1406 RepID=UPI0018CF8FF6